MASDYLVCTADTLAKDSRGKLYGYVVTTATAGAAITLYDNTSETGTVLATIPASTAAGTTVMFGEGVLFKVGLYVGFGGGASGTVNILFR